MGAMGGGGGGGPPLDGGGGGGGGPAFPPGGGGGGEGEAFGRPLCPLCNTSGLDNLGLDVDEICSLH